MRTVLAIQFDVRDWENGFFITFVVPFTADNWINVFAIPGSANIKKLKIPLESS